MKPHLRSNSERARCMSLITNETQRDFSVTLVFRRQGNPRQVGQTRRVCAESRLQPAEGGSPGQGWTVTSPHLPGRGGGGLQFSNLASLTHPPVPPLTFKGADWLQENPRQCYQVSRFTSNKSVVLVVLKHVASQWDWLLDGARLALHTTGKKLNSVLDTLLPSLRVSSSPNCVHWL